MREKVELAEAEADALTDLQASAGIALEVDGETRQGDPFVEAELTALKNKLSK
jgi:phage shock protein A